MSMYLDDRSTFAYKRTAGVPKKRYSGEVIGPYKLLRIAGEGANADVTYWKAECSVCGLVVTIRVQNVARLSKQKGCKGCKGVKVETQASTSTTPEC